MTPRNQHVNAGPIKVTAIATGFYGDVMRRPGDEFAIKAPEHFSTAWMVSEDPRVIAHLTDQAASEAAAVVKSREASK